MPNRLVGAPPSRTDDSATKGYADGTNSCLPAVGETVYTDGILTATNAGVTSGRMTAHPMWVAPGTYDALVVSVGTALVAGSATILSKAAIYADDTNQGTHFMPLTPNPLASVTIPLTGITLAVGVLGTPWVCPGGFYWGAFVYTQSAAPTTAPTVACISNCTWSIGQTNAFTNRMRGWGRTGLTDLPTTASTTANMTRSAASDIVVVGLRRG